MLSPGNHLLTLRVPRLFARPKPGQFVHLRVCAGGEFMLRRPYSIEGYFERGGLRAIRIYFSVVGRGSRMLSEHPRGRELDLIGPLGVGFAPKPRRTAILVAGGRGVAPLLCLQRWLHQRKQAFVLLFGARTRKELYGVKEVRGGRLHLATDDGSVGVHRPAPRPESGTGLQLALCMGHRVSGRTRPDKLLRLHPRLGGCQAG